MPAWTPAIQERNQSRNSRRPIQIQTGLHRGPHRFPYTNPSNPDPTSLTRARNCCRPERWRSRPAVSPTAVAWSGRCVRVPQFRDPQRHPVTSCDDRAWLASHCPNWFNSKVVPIIVHNRPEFICTACQLYIQVTRSFPEAFWMIPRSTSDPRRLILADRADQLRR